MSVDPTDKHHNAGPPFKYVKERLFSIQSEAFAAEEAYEDELVFSHMIDSRFKFRLFDEHVMFIIGAGTDPVSQNIAAEKFLCHPDPDIHIRSHLEFQLRYNLVEELHAPCREKDPDNEKNHQQEDNGNLHAGRCPVKFNI